LIDPGTYSTTDSTPISGNGIAIAGCPCTTACSPIRISLLCATPTAVFSVVVTFSALILYTHPPILLLFQHGFHLISLIVLQPYQSSPQLLLLLWHQNANAIPYVLFEFLLSLKPSLPQDLALNQLPQSPGLTLLLIRLVI